MQDRTRPHLTLAALGLAAMAAITAPAAAQSVSYGILAGASLSDFANADVPASTSAGFAGGFYAGVPLRTSLVLEPELLYTNKGANLTGSSATVNLNYIEVPVLLRYNFNPDGGPFAYAGPYVGFNIDCNTTTTVATVNCSDASVNANTVFGGALGIGFQKSAWGFDLRYEYDFSDAVDAGPGKNSAFMALLRLAVK